MSLFTDARGATFSEDRKFRYRWWEIWDPAKKYLNALMLNPSTADEFKKDPTVTVVAKRAAALGYGGLIVTNAYAFKATDPKALKLAGYPVGPKNDYHIVQVAKGAGFVICGWGTQIQKARSRELLKMIRVDAQKKPHALIFTKGGEPGHPLYVPYEGCPPMEITNPNFCHGCGFEIAPEASGYCGECACEDDCAP